MSTPDANLSSAGTPATAAPPVSGAAQRSMLQIMTTLIRREFWEHRALWVTPLIIAVLLIACALLVQIGPPHLGVDERFWSDNRNRVDLLGWLQLGCAVTQFIVMSIVLNFYLLDCLYLERKDRSILFWKSMPVSDGATVASKLLTALVVVPLGVYALTLLTNLILSGIWIGRASFGGVPAAAGVWNTMVWLKVEALILVALLASILWYAPLAAYLLLVSAWARRNVFLWAILPPIIALLIERVSTGTHYVSELIEYRTWGHLDWLNLQPSVNRAAHEGHRDIVSLPGVFDDINMSQLSLNIDLWLGLAVAAGFMFAAARIRRYRDDT